MQTLLWLFDFRGLVRRADYVRWGCGLMLVKLGLDWLLCTVAFPQPWSPRIYLMAVPASASRTGLDAQWWFMASLALPFCWVGAALTVRRLRDAAVSPWFSALFVVAVINLVLFAFAAAMPTDDSPRQVTEKTPGTTLPWPATAAWPAAFATLAATGQVWLASELVHEYGGVLFLGAPFLQGFLAGALALRRPFRGATGQFALSAVFCMALLLAAAFEGIVCIVMATPIWLVMGTCGVLLGRAVTREAWRTVVPALLVLPAAQLLEPRFRLPPSVYEVTTEVVVEAEPPAVWAQLVTFGEIAEPTELLFRAGIAYPIRATIEGRGAGAVRRCTFTTGDFVEPIEVWDEPRLLRFSVEQCPPPMIEWNPFHGHVDAAHLHGFFAAMRGQFELSERGDGTTLLRGTTWYSHGLYPEFYWQLWSEPLLHAIHRRVLEHIRQGAER